MNQARRQALIEHGCIACVINGFFAGNPEVHHIVTSGYRKHSGGDEATLPLCAWHHRAEPWIDFPKSYMRERFGPSMADEAKAFVVEFGTQRELLAKVNDTIGKSL